MTIEEIYEQHIRKLPRKERLRLLAMTAEGLTEKKSSEPKRHHKITELAGLGKEIWQSIDAQEYVDSARDEWERKAS